MLEGLQQYAAQIGVPLSDEQAQAMRTYWAAVLETNRHTNLTRITDDKEATLKHFIDSLSVLPTGVFGPGARVADVGTGAGFPGVPLKIARPDLKLVLIDSTLKRVRFLRSVIRLLGWDDVEAVHARAEALAANPKWAGTFDLVVARAVAKLDSAGELVFALAAAGRAAGGHERARRGRGAEGGRGGAGHGRRAAGEGGAAGFARRQGPAVHRHRGAHRGRVTCRQGRSLWRGPRKEDTCPPRSGEGSLRLGGLLRRRATGLEGEPKDEKPAPPEAAAAAAGGEDQIRRIAIDAIAPSPYQPRMRVDEGACGAGGFR